MGRGSGSSGCRTWPTGWPRPQQRCCWKRSLSRSSIPTATAIVLGVSPMTPWPWPGSVVGNRTGCWTLTSGPFSTASPMICCSKRSLTTPTSDGSCSTSNGGSKPPCRCRTGPSSPGRKEPPKGLRSRPVGQPVHALCVRSVDGPGVSRAVRSSAMRTTLLPTATPRNRPGTFGPPSPSGSGPWVSSCTPTRPRSCSAKTRTAGEVGARQLRLPRLHLPGPPGRGPRAIFVSFSPAMSTKAKKAIGQTDQGLAPQPSHWDGPVRPRRGHQPSGARLDQLLRGLLPLRVVLPRTAHQRTPRPMGHAEVQTTSRQAPARAWEWLAGCRTAANQGCSPTGRLPALTPVDLWEPYDGRLSRTVLREREGEVPSRHSPASIKRSAGAPTWSGYSPTGPPLCAWSVPSCPSRTTSGRWPNAIWAQRAWLKPACDPLRAKRL